MSDSVPREAKVALQRELLAEIAPELVGEIDRLEKLLVRVRTAVALSDQDIETTRPYQVTKYVQGRVDGGDAVMRRLREALS